MSSTTTPNDHCHLYDAVKYMRWHEVHSQLKKVNARKQVEYTDTYGWNALHNACHPYHLTPVDIMKNLTSVSSRAALQKNASGLCPLHYALSPSPDEGSTGSWEEVIIVMIRACPAAVGVMNESWLGNALHHGIYYERSTRILREMIKACPSAMGVRNQIGVTPLVMFFQRYNLRLRTLVERCDTREGRGVDARVKSRGNTRERVVELAPYLLCAAAVTATTMVDNYAKDTTTSLTVTLTLAMLSPHCPWSVCQTLLDAIPPLAATSWAMGLADKNKTKPHRHHAITTLPLHTVAALQPSYDATLYECGACTLPLKPDGVWYIHEVDAMSGSPRALYCKDCFSYLSRPVSNQRYRGLPYHEDRYIDFVSLNKNMKAVEALLILNPMGASVPDENGTLPLHIATSAVTSLQGSAIIPLFEAEPMALATRGVTSHLYPFALAAVNRNDDDDSGDDDEKGEDSSRMLEQFCLCFHLLMLDPSLVVS